MALSKAFTFSDFAFFFLWMAALMPTDVESTSPALLSTALTTVCSVYLSKQPSKESVRRSVNESRPRRLRWRIVLHSLGSRSSADYPEAAHDDFDSAVLSSQRPNLN